MNFPIKISLIIPCLNESKNLSELIPYLLKNGGALLHEIIVVDANSTDGSAEIAKSFGVRCLTCSQGSRAAQMNAGAKIAMGDVLYFVHADTRPLVSFGFDIQAAISSGKLAGCYRYEFDSKSILLRINGWFTKFNGMFSGGGDQTLFIGREFFGTLGGFDETFCIMEDFELVRRIKRVTQFVIIPKKIKVSARKYKSNSWLRVQLANFAAFSFFLLKVKPHQIKGLYYSLLHPSTSQKQE